MLDETDILLVDDNTALRALLARVMRRAGWRVGEAAGSDEAMAALSLSPPRLMLTDIHMPDGSGIALAEAARQRHPGLRILFMTGFSFDAPIPAGLAAGPVLQKPFQGDRLLALVATQLGQPQAAA